IYSNERRSAVSVTTTIFQNDWLAQKCSQAAVEDHFIAEFEMVIELLRGLGIHSRIAKRHYFHDGRSLCGRFYAVCPRMTQPAAPEVAAFFYCVPCERKLKTGRSRKRHF